MISTSHHMRGRQPIIRIKYNNNNIARSNRASAFITVYPEALRYLQHSNYVAVAISEMPQSLAIFKALITQTCLFYVVN